MHIPVLLSEAVKFWGGLDKNGGLSEGIYVDGTFGEGGHSMELIKISSDNQKIKIVGLDWDRRRIDEGKEKYEKSIQNKKLYLISGGFQNIKEIVSKERAKNPELRGLNVKGVLLDLGMGSHQLSEKRGFSFKDSESPLDMRYNFEEGLSSAGEVLNSWSREELENLFRNEGEERHARLIAKEIVAWREKGNRFKKVGDIVDLLEKCVGKWYKKSRIHFATRTFQALRMAVNKEKENIDKGLGESEEILGKGGRLVVISFHSGEDRKVKRFLRFQASDCVCPEELPVCICNHRKTMQVLTKKPIIPTEEEIYRNPRARSAKMRVGEKIR